MKFFISSNVNILGANSAWNYLKKKNQISIDGYNKILVSLNDSRIISENNCFFNIIYLNDYLKSDYIKIINSYKKIIKKNKSKNFFFIIYLQLFDNYEEDKLIKKKSIKVYNELINLKTNNVFTEIISTSCKNVFSLRNNYYLRCPFSQDEIIELSSKIKNHILKITSKTFKLIILDCDNTLWGGTLGEDGVESIEYSEDGNGKIFLDVQKHFEKLKGQGFLLSIASKNNEKDVWIAMNKRKMALNRKDFLFPKINWNEKYLNIRQTLNELSLKEDDVLFIDDDALEREKIKKEFSKMSILDIDDLGNYLNLLMEHPRLQKLSILKEDKKKYYQYNLKNKYHDLKAQSREVEKVYSELKQKVNLQKINSSNINRAEQLFNKTNQFNFSVNRYNKDQIKKINSHKNCFIRLFSLKDKFGDHGIIGLIVFNKIKNAIYISDFMISCRVLSRKIEEYILYHVLNVSNVEIGYIIFKKSDKNSELISKFLGNNFFSKLPNGEIKKLKFSQKSTIYRIDINKDLKNVKKYFKR